MQDLLPTSLVRVSESWLGILFSSRFSKRESLFAAISNYDRPRKCNTMQVLLLTRFIRNFYCGISGGSEYTPHSLVLEAVVIAPSKM
jgi:hypothetical protein